MLSNAILARLMHGDLAALNATEKLEYYVWECQRMGLDPAARPLQWVNLSGKLTLYSTRQCGDMLCAKHKLSVRIADGPRLLDGGKVLIARATVTGPDGRTVEDVGTVAANDPINGPMKVVTKAIRRATLRWCGFGGLDESELDSIPGARAVHEPTAPASHAPERPVTSPPERPAETKVEADDSQVSPVQCVVDDLNQLEGQPEIATAAAIYNDNCITLVPDVRAAAFKTVQLACRIEPTAAAMKAAVLAERRVCPDPAWAAGSPLTDDEWALLHEALLAPTLAALETLATQARATHASGSVPRKLFGSLYQQRLRELTPDDKGATP